MKKILLLITILSISVMTTACINNLAVQELNNKALDYMDKGDVQTAICRLKSSLDLDNDMYQTHYNLGVAYNSGGDYKNAVGELEKVIELNPDFNDAYYTMGAAKESLAYTYLENAEDESEDFTPSSENIAAFSKTAAEAVEAFNHYLEHNSDAKEAEAINAKISELNEKLKEYATAMPSDNL